MFKSLACAAGLCLLLSNLTSAQTLYPETPSPVQPVPTGAMLPVPQQIQNTNVKRVDKTSTATVVVLTNVEKFIPIGPPPYPNSLYTPTIPDHRRASEPTVMIRDVIPETKCPNDDLALIVQDPNTNVNYKICCPAQMSQDTNWDDQRGSQCCNDRWKQACKNDPEDVIDCEVGWWPIYDAVNGKRVCKETGTNNTAPAAPNSPSTTTMPSPTSALIITSSLHSTTNTTRVQVAPIPTEASSTTTKTTATTNAMSGTKTGGGARIGLWEMGVINGELSMPCVLLMIMITF